MTLSEKIQRLSIEPYYKDLYKQYGIDYCVDNGFFFNRNSVEINWLRHVEIPCTPINFLKKSDSKKKCILLSTGAHCPMHEGHIMAMEYSKQFLEKQGWDVIGGYLSPGHDEYIKDKTKEEYMPIHDRLDYANKLLRTDWLAIDPWEGLFAPGAVNYTTVVYRLQQYIKYWLEEDITIFYVCGADNARFHRVFKGTDIQMCIVTRSGYDLSEMINDILDAGFYIAELNNDLSSTKVRKQPEYQKYLKQRHQPKQLFLRSHRTHVEKRLYYLMQKYFSNVFINDINYQQDQFNEARHNKTCDILNLDSYIYGAEADLHISRLYDNFGQKKMGYTNRPGSPDLLIQFGIMIEQERIKSPVLLFDDDIHTGGTMKFVEEQLKEFYIETEGRFSLVTSNPNHAEILDARDFILGSEDGGLVTKIKGELVRVPYIYPFVCPKTRASINEPYEFSQYIWLLNYNYYKDTYRKLKDFPHLSYFKYLGFDDESYMEDVCMYYHRFLFDIYHI
jgi:nicotinic acid mononucleotide adenylyltransferase